MTETETTYKEEEITLKTVIETFLSFVREILRNWLLIILISLPVLAYFLYNYYSTPVKFQAPLVFMINEEEGGGGGGIAALAGQFGFSVGGGGEYNKEKIVSLSKSGRILHPAILDSIEIEGVTDLTGNHMIRVYNLHEKWAEGKNERIKGYFFPTDNADSLDIIGNMVLKQCYNLILGNKKNPPLTTCSFDENSGILNITSTSTSSALAHGLTVNIFDNLSKFYIKQQTEPQQKSYEAIKAKADSLNTLISAKEYELASLQDANNNVFLRKYKLREERLKRELPAYASQYAALLQNVENADFVLKNSTPFFQVIDYPFMPLTAVVPSLSRTVVIAVFVGLLLSVLFISGRKIIRDAMRE